MNSEEAVKALLEALTDLHLRVEPTGNDHGSDLILDLDDRQLHLQVKNRSLVDQPQAHRLTQDPSSAFAEPTSPDAVPVVVSERIVEGARDHLREAGISWLDLRGHLYLSAPGLLLDVDTNRLTASPPSPTPLKGRVGLATGIDILLNQPGRAAVRETARRIGSAPSTVSSAIKSLRNEGLVDEQGAADPQALFWAVAREWAPEWVGVARYPDPDGPLRNPALQLGFEDPRASGWALGGDLAAAELGAPIGLAAGAPPDLYVPSRQAFRLARSILGTTLEANPAARLAVGPVAAVCEHRIEPAGGHGQYWPLARELFVALDLAQDPGRGTEILESWNPRFGGVHVWR